MRELNGNMDFRGFIIKRIFCLSSYLYLHFPNISFDMFSIKVIYFYLEKQIQTVIFNTNKEKLLFKNAQKKPKTCRNRRKFQKKLTETQNKPKMKTLFNILILNGLLEITNA